MERFTTNKELAEKYDLQVRQVCRYKSFARRHLDYYDDEQYKNLTEYQLWFLEKLILKIQAKSGYSLNSLTNCFKEPNNQEYIAFSKVTFNKEVNKEVADATTINMY